MNIRHLILTIFLTLLNAHQSYGEAVLGSSQIQMPATESQPEEPLRKAMQGTWEHIGKKCTSQDAPFDMTNIDQRTKVNTTLTIKNDTYTSITTFSEFSILQSTQLARQSAQNDQEHQSINNYYNCMADNLRRTEATGVLTYQMDGALQTRTTNKKECSFETNLVSEGNNAFELHDNYLVVAVNEPNLYMRSKAKHCPNGFEDNIYVPVVLVSQNQTKIHSNSDNLKKM